MWRERASEVMGDGEWRGEGMREGAREEGKLWGRSNGLGWVVKAWHSNQRASLY